MGNVVMTDQVSTRKGEYTSDTKTFGHLTLIAARTTDGGYAINAFTGPVRHDTLCYTTGDRSSYRARYRLIAEAALNGRAPEQIAEAIHGPAAQVIAAAELVIADLVGPTSRPQVAPTMAGAHLADVTDPQHRALAQAARAGVVYRGGHVGQAPVTVLTALARKGWLTLTAKPGSRRRDWAYGEITDAGRVELARLDSLASRRLAHTA